MKRTNIYLQEDQLRVLKHLAVEEGRSFTDMVRQALDEFVSRRRRKRTTFLASGEWARRLDQLLARVRRRTQAYSGQEIERDITAAWKESRRRRSHAAGRR